MSKKLYENPEVELISLSSILTESSNVDDGGVQTETFSDPDFDNGNWMG